MSSYLLEFDDDELHSISVALQTIQYFDIDDLREKGYNDAQLAAFELCQPKKREIGMTKESLVTVHNQMSKLRDVNFDYYIDEAMKLINELK